MAVSLHKSDTKSPILRRGMRILEAPNLCKVVVKAACPGRNTAWQLMIHKLAQSTSSGAYVRPEKKLTENFVVEDYLALYQGVVCGCCHIFMLVGRFMGTKIEPKW